MDPEVATGVNILKVRAQEPLCQTPSVLFLRVLP